MVPWGFRNNAQQFWALLMTACWDIDLGGSGVALGRLSKL